MSIIEYKVAKVAEGVERHMIIRKRRDYVSSGFAANSIIHAAKSFDAAHLPLGRSPFPLSHLSHLSCFVNDH